MAHLVEEVIVIKFSKLVKTAGDGTTTITADILTALEQVAQELVGDSVIVDIEAA
jgi:hypothetical protein